MLDMDYMQNANRKRRRIIFASAILALAVLVSFAGGIYKSTAVAVGAKPAVEF
ncbi:MAG: hypothetical protein LBE09_01755 [Christensenellaceae bacterium]|jgi:hypothetical protein|nr:hypothetical protein [Christensenellaceae bacterium]